MRNTEIAFVDERLKEDFVSFGRFIASHNPFYLLSALCMLIGYYLLTGSMPRKGGNLAELLVMLGAINVYEFLIIGLGLYLVVTRRAVKHGRILLILSTIFLADATFLNVELATARPLAGGLVHILILFLGAAKVSLAVYFLKLSYRLRYIAFLCIEYAVLLGIPVLLSFVVRYRSLTHVIVYSLWWLVGIILAVKGFVLKRVTDREGTAASMNSTRTAYHTLLAMSLFVGVCAHMVAVHFVHNLNFLGVHMAPVLLGFAVFTVRYIPKPWTMNGTRRLLAVLPAVAVVFSAKFPAMLTWGDPQSALIVFTPLRICLLAAACTYGYGFYVFRRKYFIVLAVLMALMSGLGFSVETIRQSISDILPTTARRWGLLSVIASFLLLGVGAFWSLRRRAVPDNEQHSTSAELSD